MLDSPGFTAWRELEAHQRTTQWVLDGKTADFPLLYHWRVLPVAVPDPIDEHGDRDTAVAYWHGAPGVADRLAALDTCKAGLVLFMERRQRAPALRRDLHQLLSCVSDRIVDPLVEASLARPAYMQPALARDAGGGAPVLRRRPAARVPGGFAMV